jgi:curved DNA-binding protein CbpA
VANFYEVLGISANASRNEVRDAYMRLAREKHPDRFPDPAEKQQAQEFFKHVTEAFNTLSNERSRQQYDADLAKPRLEAPAEIAADAYNRGVQKIAEGDFHEAINLLRSSVQHAPEVAVYRIALARGLAKNPHWLREAMDELEQAIRLKPNDARAHYEMARLLASQNLRLRARRSAELALQLAPGQAEIQKLAAELGVGAGGDPEPPSSGGLLDRFRRKS